MTGFVLLLHVAIPLVYFSSLQQFPSCIFHTSARFNPYKGLTSPEIRSGSLQPPPMLYLPIQGSEKPPRPPAPIQGGITYTAIWVTRSNLDRFTSSQGEEPALFWGWSRPRFTSPFSTGSSQVAPHALEGCRNDHLFSSFMIYGRQGGSTVVEKGKRVSPSVCTH